MKEDPALLCYMDVGASLSVRRALAAQDVALGDL